MFGYSYIDFFSILQIDFFPLLNRYVIIFCVFETLEDSYPFVREFMNNPVVQKSRSE